MDDKKTLVWLRNDLRLRDQVALHEAATGPRAVYLVYCFSPKLRQYTPQGFPRVGAHRMQFLLQSLAALRQAARALGGDVLLREGAPEDVIPELAVTLGVGAVYVSEEVGTEERAEEDAVEKALWQRQIPLQRVWQHTLFHRDDIPWPINNLPDVFTQFRKESEKAVAVRPEVPAPQALPKPPLPAGELPTLAHFGLEEPMPESRAALPMEGGEADAWERVQHYLWQADKLREYKETRNGLLGADYSSKFSPWLALGCISPRSLYAEVQRYEQERVKNKSTYWLFFELLWRDYFRLVTRRYGARLFQRGGIRADASKLAMRQDQATFERWCQGLTGVPFIDANMRELARTGFMSNRGRQNVASFLVKDLGLDWRWGARWFEACLIDYDVASNWGNWNYVAGVGNDPRENRYFNILSQARRYDGGGDYVRHWIPELAHVPGGRIHMPPDYSPEERQQIGAAYPEPLVDMRQWD